MPLVAPREMIKKKKKNNNKIKILGKNKKIGLESEERDIYTPRMDIVIQ